MAALWALAAVADLVAVVQCAEIETTGKQLVEIAFAMEFGHVRLTERFDVPIVVEELAPVTECVRPDVTRVSISVAAAYRESTADSETAVEVLTVPKVDHFPGTPVVGDAFGSGALSTVVE